LPREVVAEFAKHLADELDLLREANARSWRAISRIHRCPRPGCWDYCSHRVMVMQRMHGTPVSQVAGLQGRDIPALARAGGKSSSRK
jgi:ubiquinone biosynthesis protein